jgi:hypothetical protein
VNSLQHFNSTFSFSFISFFNNSFASISFHCSGLFPSSVLCVFKISHIHIIFFSSKYATSAIFNNSISSIIFNLKLCSNFIDFPLLYSGNKITLLSLHSIHSLYIYNWFFSTNIFITLFPSLWISLSVGCS